MWSSANIEIRFIQFVQLVECIHGESVLLVSILTNCSKIDGGMPYIVIFVSSLLILCYQDKKKGGLVVFLCGFKEVEGAKQLKLTPG